MSADILRRAAASMREDAHQATPGRWKAWGMQVLADQDGTSDVDTAVPVASFMSADDAGRPRTWDLDHVIGMQPAVALAVADQLDAMAAVVEEAAGSPLAIVAAGLAEKSVAVATAYLGAPQ